MKKVKDLYHKNVNTLKKEIGVDIRRWKVLLCPWISRTNIVKMAIILRAIDKFNPIATKSPTHFFTEMKK